MARMRWISEPTSFKTEIPDFAGLGKTVVLTRTLTSASVMEAGVTVYDGDKARDCQALP